MRDIIKEAEEFVRNTFLNTYSPGHDWLHTNRVRKLALTIAEDYNVNKLALELAALFHDIGRIENEKNHAKISAEIAKEFLKNFDIDADTVEIAIKSIEEHDRIDEPTYLEGKILQDADKLDGMGAIGLMRVVESAVLKHMSEYDEENPFGVGFNGDITSWIEKNLKLIPNNKMRTNKYIIEEIIGKELQWINMFWTEKAKKIALRRFEFMKRFIIELFQDLKESGVI
ncbi:HD domain-containing protein [Thermococcus sp. SY098]|uniref:HD domain-containing protein n=1 Tax=Thermococcus sp. SY098 TaxID=3111325 RepID=UPI002D77D65C|nr:HD domain-containing protein [Thermococcus sp. SY098]WRS52142.1 HD domain-containing protein [Thermococcus sp. SY098]